MKLKKIMLAVALAGSVTSVYAGNINGLPTPDLTLVANGPNPIQYSGHFGNAPKGIFSDVFTFKLAANADSKPSAAFLNMDLEGAGIINFGGATLNGIAFTQTAADRWSLASTVSPSSTLTLTVWGDASNGGTYAGNINMLMAAPVPEPETYAMLLGGMALLGLGARRRKQR